MSTFTQSEQIGELIAALAKAQLEFTPALKDSDNPAFGARGKYADLATILNAVRPALNRHGIAIIQADSSELETARASVRTALHCGEQWIASTADAPAIDRTGNLNVQSLGAAWTYLRRYSLQAICGLASEDDDGNSLSQEAPEGKNLTKALSASVIKIDAEKRAASERNKLAQEQGVFSLEGDKLTCIVKGVQRTDKNGEPFKSKEGKIFVKVTFNSRFPNGIGWASSFDKKLWPVLDKALDKECGLVVELKGAFANIKNILWIDGVAMEDMSPEPLFEGA